MTAFLYADSFPLTCTCIISVSDHFQMVLQAGRILFEQVENESVDK